MLHMVILSDSFLVLLLCSQYAWQRITAGMTFGDSPYAVSFAHIFTHVSQYLSNIYMCRHTCI